MKGDDDEKSVEQLTRDHLAAVGMTEIGIQQLIDSQPVTDPNDKTIIAAFLTTEFS